MTGFLEVVACLVEILFPLWQSRMIRDRRTNRMIVAESAAPEQDLVDDSLTVHGMLEREPYIDIVERGHIAKHGHGDMRARGHVIENDTGGAGQHGGGLEVDIGHRVDIAGDDRRLPGVGIVEHRHLDRVEPCPAVRAVPAVMPLERGTDAGLELDRKSTRLNSSHSGESRMPS